MADNSWYYEIEPKILSIIKRNFPDVLYQKYPTIKFSTKSTNIDSPSYPFVYLHELSPLEIGRDTEGGNINAMTYTMQIEVSDNTTSFSSGENGKAICKRIMRNVLEIMKTLHFEIVYMEFFDGDPSTGIARVKRNIGKDDDVL